jgi:cytochrome c-type biogenesis protein
VDNNISIFASILAGVLTFASPCVLPLIPAYVSFIAGTGLNAKTSKTFLRAAAFVLGFSAVFTALGAGVGYFGAMLGANIKYFRIAAGCLVILLGLHLTGLLRVGFLYRQVKHEVKNEAASYASAVFIGMAFALAWTPCVGPVLAGVLMLAGSQGSAARGSFLLAGYSLGLGLPFILAALFINAFFKFFDGIKKYLGVIEIISGVLLVIVGVLIITGGFEFITTVLLKTFN